MRDLTGKTYWLIGASEGIGRALAQKLSAAGVRLILSARSGERLEGLAASLSGPARVVPLDIRDRDAVHQAAAEIGSVDGIAYLSGVLHPMHAQDWNTNRIEEMIDVNLSGAVRIVGEVLPDMIVRGAGHILLTGSLSAYRGMSGLMGYGASKAGIYSLAESLYADLNHSGVDVQIVHPGYIRTRMTEPIKSAKPFMIEPEVAAERIFEHMQSDAFARCFPQPIGLGAQMLQLLPDWLYFAFAGRKN